MADHREAADRSALLVREIDDLERMLETDAAFLQDLRNFDRTDHADVAVVVAAARHRVGM